MEDAPKTSRKKNKEGANMKSTLSVWLAAITLLLTVGMALPVAAQQNAEPAAHLRYKVIDLGTLPGGNFSQPFVILNNGVVSGSSNLSDNSQHAVLWYGKRMKDLGTLGGQNSIAFGVNAWGQVVGEAETSTSDPNGEDFCGFGTHLICLPTMWESGKPNALPTLGGNNGVVSRNNNWGVAAGWAETSVDDPACPPPQKLQFKPVAWEFGQPIELPVTNGDSDGIALGINDYGEVVGSSGICSTFNQNLLFSLQGVHALLWEDGKTVDLGNLGGTTGQGGGNIAFAVNNRGQAVGSSDLPGDTTSHAFLWTKATKMQDLGTLTGDIASAAISINDGGVVAGLSISASGNTRAVVWRDRIPTDLNKLVQANPPLYLLTGCSINSRGEITGLGATNTGEVHTYRAIPVWNESTVEGQ
jgi:probable HAF family extracellular repeat protein